MKTKFKVGDILKDYDTEGIYEITKIGTSNYYMKRLKSGGLVGRVGTTSKYNIGFVEIMFYKLTTEKKAEIL